MSAWDMSPLFASSKGAAPAKGHRAYTMTRHPHEPSLPIQGNIYGAPTLTSIAFWFLLPITHASQPSAILDCCANLGFTSLLGLF